MAQSDTPFGLRPVGYMDGSSWNGKVNIYWTTGAGAIYKGSPLIIGASADALGQATGCAVIAAASTDLLGVAVGFGNTRYLAADVTSLSRAYRPASVDMYIAVVDDPRVIFEVQEDNASSVMLAAASIGQSIKLASTFASGSTTTGLSTCELSSAAGDNQASNSGYPLRLWGIRDRTDNTMGAAYCKWLVTINNHSLGGGRVGI